jgi:rRNA maturation endonuclease Nob1
MAKPIKFRFKKEFKIMNRCIICGRIVSSNKIICDVCSGRNRFPRVRR